MKTIESSQLTAKDYYYSDFIFQLLRAAPPSEEDESLLTCYLTTKFIHDLRR